MKHLSLFATFLLLMACTQAPEDKLDKACRRLFPSDDEPGAAVLVLQGDSILFDRGYGLADLELRTPIDGNTFFNIASVSKQFTAEAILQLAQAGLLSLDDPVSKYYPEFSAAFWNDVKIKHLLSHSSGIPDARGYLTREQKIAGDEALAMEYLPGLDSLNFQPGTAYEYINPTFVLCGDIVEKLSGQAFTDYVAQHIFQPAGMQESLYFDPAHQELIPRMAHGYVPVDELPRRWAEYDYGEETFFATRPDGGIYTSTHEFVLWEKALQDHRLLDSAWQELAFTPQIVVSGSPWSDYQNRPNTYYGLGWFIEPETTDSQKVIYHTGDNGGFQILAARYPDSKTLVLVFSNRHDWNRYAFMQEIEEVYGLARRM